MAGTHRIGHGYDLHRLEPCVPMGNGRPFVLGGIRFEHDRGPVAHSDGDVLMHAVTDAILGAIGAPDIGQLFPDTAPENDGRDSRIFLEEAARRMRAAGWEIGNMDMTVICERPKLGARKQEVVQNRGRPKPVAARLEQMLEARKAALLATVPAPPAPPAAAQ